MSWSDTPRKQNQSDSGNCRCPEIHAPGEYEHKTNASQNHLGQKVHGAKLEKSHVDGG
jgi:hypothetical protein